MTADAQYAYESLGAFLSSDGWQPEELTEEWAYRTAYHGAHGDYPVLAAIRPKLSQLVVYVQLPGTIETSRRIAAADLICRMNRGLTTGAFEIDLDDGTVCFRVGLDFAGAGLPMALLRNALYRAVLVADRLAPAVTCIAEDEDDEITAEEALSVLD